MPPIIGQEESEQIFIFDLTLQEARDHFSKTQNYKDSLKLQRSEELLQFGADIQDVNLPTLDQVFALFEREVLVNIEVKTPSDPTNRPQYNSDKLIETMHEALQNKFNTNMFDKPAVEYSFISSFDHDWIQRYQAYEASASTLESDRAKFIFLYSRKPEDALPRSEETDAWSKGVNCQPSCAT